MTVGRRAYHWSCGLCVERSVDGKKRNWHTTPAVIEENSLCSAISVWLLLHSGDKYSDFSLHLWNDVAIAAFVKIIRVYCTEVNWCMLYDSVDRWICW